MATRVTFLCAAATAASRLGAFPAPDDALDEGGARKASAFRLHGARPVIVLTSPARAAIETAAALGLDARVDPRAADLDFGAWSGRSLADVEGAAPDALAAWLADPAGRVPGGETMSELQTRIGTLVDEVADAGAALLVICHAAPIRAALAHALMMPLASALRIDIAPLSTLVLSRHGDWRLQELRRAGG